MTDFELNSIISALGITKIAFCRATGYSYRSLCRFCNGTKPIPNKMALAARALMNAQHSCFATQAKKR